MVSWSASKERATAQRAPPGQRFGARLRPGAGAADDLVPRRLRPLPGLAFAAFLLGQGIISSRDRRDGTGNGTARRSFSVRRRFTRSSRRACLAQAWRRRRRRRKDEIKWGRAPSRPTTACRLDGKLSGYDIDVANEVCRRANLKCNLIAQDWDSQIPSLIAGKFDAVLTMGPNPKRREVIEFTVPYAQTSNTFGVLKSGPLAKLPNTGEALSVDEPAGRSAIEALTAALKGKTVGVALSTSQQQFVEEAFKGVVTVRTYKTSEQHTLDLLAGRVDAVFDNIVYLRDAVERPGNQDLTMAGPLVKGGVMATDTCIGVRKGEAGLKAQLDKAIQAAICRRHRLDLSDEVVQARRQPEELTEACEHP